MKMLMLFLAIAADATAANDDKLSITLAKRTITVSGLSPGGSAVFFGVGQVAIPGAYMNQVRRWAVTVDDTDHKGTATFDLQQDIPAASVWAVASSENDTSMTASTAMRKRRRASSGRIHASNPIPNTKTIWIHSEARISAWNSRINRREGESLNCSEEPVKLSLHTKPKCALAL